MSKNCKRILIFGSTQIVHIRPIYISAGWEVEELETSDGNFAAKLRNLLRCVRSDTLYCVGGQDYCCNRLLKLGKLLNKRIIVHWIGTDVMRERKRFKETGQIINKDIINLTVTEELRRELEPCGISSIYIPIVPSGIPYPPAPELPKEHAVMVYVPKGRESFYGWPHIRMLAEKYPNIAFYIVANDGSGETDVPENIYFKGKLPHDELMELYTKISILIRHTEHDGLPVMIIEALGMGRKVIYNHSLPYVLSPADNSFGALEKVFKELVSVPPEMDTEAKSYIDSIFSHANLREMYLKNELA